LGVGGPGVGVDEPFGAAAAEGGAHLAGHDGCRPGHGFLNPAADVRRAHDVVEAVGRVTVGSGLLGEDVEAAAGDPSPAPRAHERVLVDRDPGPDEAGLAAAHIRAGLDDRGEVHRHTGVHHERDA